MQTSIKSVLFFLLLLSSIAAFGQQQAIKGHVTDLESGEDIGFASVFLLGSLQGANCDEFGKFQFATEKKSGKVVAKFIGYSSDTLDWVEGKHLHFALKSSNAALEEVVVTGTLKEVTKSESAVPIEVYSSKFFLRNPTPSLFDAMQNINGVRPQLNCSVCNTGDIHINGMEGPYTMILIDGLPIVSGLSTVYGLSGIPNSMIQRVEVVKGPAATLYGAEAVGGLINVITKAPLDAPELSVDVSSTSYLENNIDIGYSKTWKKVSTLLSANYFNLNQRWDKNSDNFTDITLQNRLSIFNKYQFSRKMNRQANLAVRYVWEDRFGGDMRWSKQFRGGDSLYGESIYTKRLEVMGNYQLPTSESLLFTYSFNQHNQNSVYGTTSFVAKQNIAFGQLTWDKALGNHNLLSGLALRYTFYDDNTPITSTATLENMPSRIWLPGIFVQDEITLNAKHKLLPGIRYDNSSNQGGVFTPRFSYKFSPNTNNTLRLTYGSGYRVAYVFSEDHAALNGGREVVIKNSLNPERSQNVNINYVTKFFPKFGFIGLDASVFYTYFNNKIVADFLTDPNKIIFDNLDGHGVSQGITLNADFNFKNGLKMVAGFTALEVFTNVRNEKSVFEKLPQMLTPNLTANWSVSYTIPGIDVTIDYTGFMNSPMLLPVLENDFRDSKSPWFSIQNIQVSRKWKRGIEVYGGVKNLLNFMPKDPIMRPFDPFDKDIANNNPNGYTFDASYSYAAVQGIRGFLGFRVNIKNLKR